MFKEEIGENDRSSPGTVDPGLKNLTFDGKLTGGAYHGHSQESFLKVSHSAGREASVVAVSVEWGERFTYSCKGG